MTTAEFRAKQYKIEAQDALHADIFVSAVCLVSTLVAAYHFFQWVPK